VNSHEKILPLITTAKSGKKDETLLNIFHTNRNKSLPLSAVAPHADERFFPRVCPHVSLEVVRSRELFLAGGAFERLVSCFKHRIRVPSFKSVFTVS
jgi:hypothetical protein